jgi:threonine aldolase
MSRIDLRSDTVTRPSPDMLAFMSQAKLGDDVYGEDPTVKELEVMAADLCGMEAAVFAPSGTQSNLIGLMAHCQRGDEYIVGQTAHTYMWEGGGAAVLGSIQPQPIDVQEDGTLCLNKVVSVIKPSDDHHPRTKLLCLENTIAGKVLPLSYLKEALQRCQEHNLMLHLDGARVFNAAVKLNVPLLEITQYVNSVSICMSKGLGAPVGSVLCGNQEFIQVARRWRKVVGGGMRQAGILAAAAIYALRHNVARLAEDHENATYLAQELNALEEIEVDLSSLQTNIFYVNQIKDFDQLKEYLHGHGIILPQANKNGHLRLVTHLDVSRRDIEKVIQEIKNFYTQA